MNQIEIGRFIASLRKEQNMTQRNLAELLGVTDRAISKWENGRGLPDVLLMKRLCSIFNISIDELLNAKKNIDSDKNDNNVLNVLLERELEFRKRKRLQIVCAILFCFLIMFGSVFSVVSVSKIISGIKGEGSTFNTDFYSKKAEYISNCIVDDNFKKASEHIGFLGLDKSTAQQDWAENMENLVVIVDIEAFYISKIILDDYFPTGKYYITVYDCETGARYIFDGQITIQDKGVVFGGIYLSTKSTDLRRKEVVKLIENALCTWNPG